MEIKHYQETGPETAAPQPPTLESERSQLLDFLRIPDNLKRIQWSEPMHRTDDRITATTRRGVLKNTPWGELSFWYFELDQGSNQEPNDRYRTRWIEALTPDGKHKLSLDFDGPHKGDWLFHEGKHIPGINIRE